MEEQAENQLEKLQNENRILSEQVKRLLKTEHDLGWIQEQLDTQIRLYRQLYEVGKQFNTTFNLTEILHTTTEFVLYELNFERCLVLLYSEETKDFCVQALDGYYDEDARQGMASLSLSGKEPGLLPLRSGSGQVMCTAECDQEHLLALGHAFGMAEYVIFPLGGEPQNPIRLLVAGNTVDNLSCYTRIQPDSEFVIGLANLVSLTTTTINNVNFYQALRENEKKYRTLFEDSRDAIFITTPVGKFVDINQATLDLFGYPRAEMMGLNARDVYVDPADRSRFQQAIEQTGSVRDFEVKFKKKDGTEMDCLLTATVRQADDGSILAYQGIVRDITERKQAEEELRKHRDHLEELVKERTAEITAANEQLRREITERKRAEEALRESEERFALAVQGSNDAVWDWDIQNNSLYWSPRLKELLGYADDELDVDFETFDALLHPDDKEHTGAAIDIHLKDGGLYDVEQRLRTKSGEYCWLRARGQAVWDEAGNPVRMVGFTTDITERKRAEEALQQAKEAAEVANQAKSAFLATMSHEIRTPMNGVIGMTSLLLDTNLTPQQREFVETIRNSGDALLTIINAILDFSKIEANKLELEIQPFNLRECVEGALDLLVTKAEEKGIELGALIEAHVPVAILGDITRLRQILVNLLNNALKFTHQGEVVVSVQTAIPLLGGARGGSADSEGTGTLQPTPCPSQEGKIPTPTLSQEGKIPTPTPSQEGKIPTPTPSQEGNFYDLHFIVRDTGIGIPKDRMDRLFQSFSQVDASTTRKYGGTGLGLAISKRLAELMGGKMWVESEEGRGSKFHFTIRAEVTEVALPVYLEHDQPILQGKRVLIVDDNDTNRKILTLQTESWEMTAVAVASGADALVLIRQGDPFDLAILDMHMPEMDGFTLAEEIRHYRDANTLPLVLLSSIGQQEQDERMTLFVAFLSKPIKASQLYNTLVGLFVGEAAIPGRRIRAQVNEQSLFDPTMGERLPLRILLVEDNATNQKLALHLLKRLGYRADVAANGLEAVEALQQRPYDVVFMDVQMPEMDGLEATRCIRREWSGDQGPRIIAMTANVMQGDRELCLEAGMNDYISKPIRIEELIAALQKCQPGKQKAVSSKQKAEEPTPGPSQEGNKAEEQKSRQTENIQHPASSIQHLTSTPAVLDSKALDKLGEMAGDADFFTELITSFLTTSPQLLTDMRQALEQGDAAKLSRAAHTLKSGSADFGALTLSGLCKNLEMKGKAGTLDGAAELIAQIEAEYERVKVALEALQTEKGT